MGIQTNCLQIYCLQDYGPATILQEIGSRSLENLKADPQNANYFSSFDISNVIPRNYNLGIEEQLDYTTQIK